MKTVRQKRPILFTLILSLLAAYFVQFTPGQAKAGWMEEWNAVVAKAKQEGKVVVWGPPGANIRKAITEEFSKAFPGISVEYTGNRGGKHTVKLKAERKGGIYGVDIILTGGASIGLRIKPLGALDPIRPALILPEVLDLSKWRNNHIEYVDIEQKYALSFVSQVSPVMNYDPKQVKVSEIDELYELLDPKWKGKILINDPIPPGAARSYFHWVWNVLGPEKAKDFYKRLRAQAAVVSREQRRQIEWVARGKYPLLVGPSHGTSQQLLSQGVKFGIRWDYKDYGVRKEEIKWVTEVSERVHLKLPPNVSMERIPPGETISQMLISGEIGAAMYWEKPQSEKVRYLFQDPVAEGIDYYKKTKIFPIMHTVAMKRVLYDRHPWMACSILNAYEESKKICYLWRNRYGGGTLPWLGSVIARQNEILGDDPFPYNLKSNLHVMETLARYSANEGMIEPVSDIGSLFVECDRN